ncbi:hypothetical protein PQR37_34425 [Paraburkholderia nemoris]|uniref:hypothetical protein n=1 Tax=Paraburkholderia TaxID=1822464 RepID=UPI0038BA0C94
MDLKDVSSLVTAAVAFYVATTWREQTTGKRRIELAEQTLAYFYEARDAINELRSSDNAIDGFDPPRQDADGLLTNSARRASALLGRIERHSEMFAKIRASRYQFHAMFGVTSPDPFADLQDVLTRITRAAHLLVGLGRNAMADGIVGTEEERQRFRRRESRWQAVTMRGANDGIAQRVNTIIANVETICRPVLDSQTLTQKFKRLIEKLISTATKIG